jgi:long-chain fatty acid transport protein
MTGGHQLSLGAAILAACTLAAPAASAGGFYVPEQGAKSVSMAGSGVTASGDVSAIFHNPAALVGAGKFQVEAGVMAVFPSFTFFRRPANNPFPTGPSDRVFDFAPAKSEGGPGFVPFIGAASDLGVKDFALGVALYVPFGASLNLPESGSQRHVVTRVALHALHVTPTVAYRFAKRLSVGLGLSYINAAFHLEQRNASPFVLGNPDDFPNPSPDVEGATKIEAHDKARFGATLGVHYQDPSDKFALGTSVMIPTRLDFRGDVSVTNRPDAIVAMNDAQGNPLPAGRRDDAVALRMPLPLVVRLGAAVKPTPDVTIALDVNYQRWSTMRTLTLFFEHNYPLLPQPGAQMNDVLLHQSWRDTTTVRLATEITPLGPNGLPLKVRAGVLYDPSPIPDRNYDMTTPDADKLGLSLGAGYRFKLGETSSLGVDLAYMHLFFAERDIAPGPHGAGSDRTILNKPAPSFFYGVTRASVDLVALTASLRL